MDAYHFQHFADLTAEATAEIAAKLLTESFVTFKINCSPGGCNELCELACASTIEPFAVDIVVVLCPEPRSLFFLVKPPQPKLRRSSARKSNKKQMLSLLK
ncbi:MAG: hypothetical protein JWQ42_2518 [Edaphobacter sp.]|nr:hypothetical protein [Edaphobacter sp.]